MQIFPGMHIRNALRGAWSWTSVGWLVALLVGVWGGLLGTADFKTAGEIFVVTGAVVAVKWATVCVPYRKGRIVALIVGELILIAGVVFVLAWTQSKGAQATKERTDREEQARTIQKLREDIAATHADLTGDNAYPEVVARSYVSPMQFSILNRGKSPLQNISVSISRMGSHDKPAESIFLGAIPVGGSRDLPFTISPTIESDAAYVGDRQIDSWLVDFSATNGMFEQRLDFRRTKDCEAVWEIRSTFLWKQSEPQSVIKRGTDFGSFNLTNVCH